MILDFNFQLKFGHGKRYGCSIDAFRRTLGKKRFTKMNAKEIKRIKANLSQKRAKIVELKQEQAKIKASLREKQDERMLLTKEKKCFSHITEKIKLSKKLRYAARSGKFDFLEKVIQKIAVDQINAKSTKNARGWGLP